TTPFWRASLRSPSDSACVGWEKPSGLARRLWPRHRAESLPLSRQAARHGGSGLPRIESHRNRSMTVDQRGTRASGRADPPTIPHSAPAAGIASSHVAHVTRRGNREGVLTLSKTERSALLASTRGRGRRRR